MAMEGGDNNSEQLTQAEESKPEVLIADENTEASSENLTDSIIDDDLVVIPSQNEQTESQESAQPDPEPEPATDVLPSASVTSQSAEPLPQASVPPSEQSKPSGEDVPPHRVVPPPPPNPDREPRPSRPTMPMTAAKPVKAIEEEDDDEDFEDETVMERLIGLTEMFPKSVRTATEVTVGLSISGLKKLFNFSRSAMWIGSTSFMVLILPIVFETEMVHMEQAQIQRQKQILLGPNAATAGAMTGAMTPQLPGVSVAAAPPEAR